MGAGEGGGRGKKKQDKKSSRDFPEEEYFLCVYVDQRLSGLVRVKLMTF